MVAISDVARRAGVSKMSVSRVLNDSPLVNEATRQRVLRAMTELNYTPSAPARSLKGGRTRLLGVCVPNTNNPIYNLYVDGIKDTAYAAGYGVIVCKTGREQQGEMESLRLWREQRIAGVIMTSPGWKGHIPALTRSGVVVVSIDFRAPHIDHITIDNMTAASQAVEHLARLGHRRIGVITGPLNIRSESERLVGYRRAMRRAGLPIERRLQGTATGFDDPDAVRVAGWLLAPAGRPSALVVSSSNLTPGVLAVVAEMGLRIPDDFALVGVGEMSWTPTLISPITSLVEPAYEMGAQACRFLFERLTGQYTGPARRLAYPAPLVVRLSCGAPVEERDPSLRSHSLLFFQQAGRSDAPYAFPAAPMHLLSPAAAE